MIILIPACSNSERKVDDSSKIDTPDIPCDSTTIPNYTAKATEEEIVIDGYLGEETWQSIEKSSNFRDLINGSDTRYETKVALSWDAENLYVAYWVEEPNLQASLTERDAPIYRDNDVELFVAGKDAYYEFEINTYGTIYEVFFIWDEAFEKSGYAALPEFNKKAEKVRTFHGVGYKNHPRGTRTGFWNWDFPGLKSAVQYEGTLNDSTDIDQGWTVELALPWSSMKTLAMGDHRSLPPKEGDTWRMDFSRFNQRKYSPDDSGGWAWSPHGVWDSHVPECFTFIHFSTEVILE